MISDIAHAPAAQFCLLLVADIFLSAAFLRQHPSLRLLVHVVFFVSLTALLITNDIEPYQPGSGVSTMAHSLFVGTAKTVWWISGAMVLVSLVRIVRAFEKHSREGRLLQDVLVGSIYLGAGLSVVAYVFGVPVGTVIATSGVFAVILGLALQSTLNDVFSGIALNLGRPYSVGNWIELADGAKGRVVETNWRSTHLLSGSNDLVVIPNSALAKATLTNLSTPDESHGIALSLSVAPVRTPAAIEEVMRNVLMSSNSILKFPPPSVTISSISNNAIVVELSCRVADRTTVVPATNELYDLAFRHCRAASLPLAGQELPAPSATVPAQHSDQAHGSQPGSASRLLNTIPLFAPLTDAERGTLSADMVRKTYAKGTIIAEQFSTLSSLMIVRTGVLLVTRHEQGVETELTRLAPGDFFGEGGVLTGVEEVGKITALTFAVVYEIAQETLADLMRERPILAEELGVMLSQRLEAEHKLIGALRTSSNDNHAHSLAEKIRHLFQLRRAG